MLEISSKERKKALLPPKTLKVHKGNLFGFYRFIHERHSIWHRRFVLQQKPPWTKDPILKEIKFTNVYRKLDRGTIWLIKNLPMSAVNPYDKSKNKVKYEANIIFGIIAYRMLNRIETFEKIGYIPVYWGHWGKDFSVVRKDLEQIAKRGEAVFTSAHSLPPAPKGMTKIDGYMLTLLDLHKKMKNGKLYFDIKASKSFEEVFHLLRKIRCVGPFFAYQIARDLVLFKIIEHSEEEWAEAGPGCKFGIDTIFSNRNYISYLDAMKWLTKNQQRMFAKLKLDFPYLGGREPLGLGDIENVLCEWGKYFLISHKLGRARIHYKYANSKIDEYNRPVV